MQALLLAEVISSVGSLMSVVALPWFVLETTGSVGRMGLVLAVEAAPLALLAVAGARIAGRLGPRRTLLVCDATWALAIGAIPAVHAVGVLSFGLLLGLAFLAGIPWAAHYGAQDTLVADLAGATEVGIAKAKAVFQSVGRLAYFLGPALGGVLLASFNASLVLVVDAVSFAASFALIATFVKSEHQEQVPDGERTPAGAGLAFIGNNPTLRVITAAQVLSQGAFMAMTAAIPALVFNVYGRHAGLAGGLLAAWGGGAMLGGAVAFRAVASYDPLRLGAAGWLLQAAPLWLMIASPLPALAVAAMALSGLGNGIRVPPIAGVATQLIPRAHRAETLTVSSSLILGGGFGALLLTAPALGLFGPTAVFGGLAATQTVAAWSIWQLGSQRRDPLTHAERAA